MWLVSKREKQAVLLKDNTRLKIMINEMMINSITIVIESNWVDRKNVFEKNITLIENKVKRW